MNALCALLLAATVAAAPLRVGRIDVVTTPLFSPVVAQRGAFYRAANRLAVATPARLIRKFLLFREGEPFDESLLRETERNLLALDFLASAKVTASAPHDGVIDVLVETEDAWTTMPNFDFSNDGGRSLYDLDVSQMDLFGTGAALDVRFANGRERRTASLELSAPAAFGPYWNGDVLLAKSSDGNEEKLVVERPLFSHTAPYTLSFAFDHLLQDARVYASGEVSSVFRQQHREVAVTAGSTLFSTSTGATRLLYGVDLLDDSFRALRGVEPSDRDFRFIEVGADTTNLIFRRLDHVDFGMRAQDFDISAHAAMIGGWSPPTRGRGVVWRVRANGSDGFLLSPNTLVVSSVAASMRAGDSNRNVVVSSDTHFVVRLDTTLPQAFVARLRVDRGSDLDRDVEFFADGQNGLRAYPNFAFAGASRVVFNAEHRVYLGRELLDLFEPGAALFIDSGRAGRGALRTDVGAGFRIGIARFQSAMLRFDVAYAMNNSPLSRRGLVFSFATTQAF